MSVRRLALAIAAVSLAACQAEEPVAPEAAAVHMHPAAVKVEEVRQADLAKLHRAIEPYNRIKLAKEGGWNFIIPNLDGRLCFRSPEGAMGFHYANTALIEDGVVDLKRPEALLFEPPHKEGERHRLVGVEYIVPIALWNRPTPPRLFGREFSEVPGFGVYGLHVWVEKSNPKGLFAPYNPRVSCNRVTN
jgi:hypothetical protein